MKNMRIRTIAIAALAGLLAAGAAQAQITPAATIDTATKGTWVGVYGSQGYVLGGFDGGDRVSLPGYISGYTTSGNRYKWTSSTDVRAVQDPANTNTRVASCWYNTGTWNVTLTPSQTGTFRFGLYFLDWDNAGRSLTMTISGAGLTGTESVSSYNGGKWYIYTVSATVGTPIVVAITYVSGGNVVLNAITFDPPLAPSAPAITNGAAQNIAAFSADIVGTLMSTSGAPTTAYLYWATNDCTTNAAAWIGGGGVTNLGVYPVTTFTNTLSGLSSNTLYYFNHWASNAIGTAWASTNGSPSFRTQGGPPGVDNDGGATGIGPNSATLRGTLTNGSSAHVYFHWGNAPGDLPNTLDVGTVSEGPFSQNLTGLERATTYYYRACASNVYGGEVTVPATNFTTLPYVWITASTNLVESQTNLYNGLSVVADGAGVVLTLSNSATYGVLPVYQFGSYLIVTNGASVVGLSQGGMSPYTVTNAGVAIQSAGDIVIASGSSINADYKGFAGRTGPGGAYANWVGGNHGGRGLNDSGTGNTNATYGSATAPTTLGSGGQDTGSQGAGGGAIKLIVPGNLTVSGTLSANGQGGGSWAGGGGAGGSIWITGGGTLGGTGEVQVSGGGGEYGDSGGGGGRISVDDTMGWNFSGNVRGANGPIVGNGGLGSAGSVYIGTRASANFTVVSNQTIVMGSDIENVFGNLTVYGTLVPAGDYAGQGTCVVIRATNITVISGGAISANGWGLMGGPAPGGYGTGVGGSHGGRGINNTNALYGAVVQPTTMGSGSAVPGGGAMKLVVSGTLTVNGAVSANGQSLNYGCGAGGSIWITGGGTLQGNGEIQAWGESNFDAVGGGGGRISIDDTMSYAFLGNIKVGKNYDGQPGTLYLSATARQNFTIDTNQTFIIGNAATYTFGTLTVKGTLDCGSDRYGAAGGTGLLIRASALTVTTSGVIKADSRGFYRGQGPGLAAAGSVGATHAGIGYLSTSNAYGSAPHPTTLGSGGLCNGTGDRNYRSIFGGGAIQLIVTGALTVNGTLSANGGALNGTDSGSAGGSLWIDAGTLAGSGGIRADGGVSTAGGGGGRIAIRYRGKSYFAGLPAPGLYTNLQTISSTVTVKGGYNTSANGVEDGSIYIESVSIGTSVFFR